MIKLILFGFFYKNEDKKVICGSYISLDNDYVLLRGAKIDSMNHLSIESINENQVVIDSCKCNVGPAVTESCHRRVFVLDVFVVQILKFPIKIKKFP